MLGKLTKYELIATSKHFLPIYAAILILSVINRVFVLSGSLDFIMSTSLGKFFSFILMALFTSMIVALGVITLIVVIQRFYKNLYGDEGYLMHTLPVHKWQLLFSKTVASVAWIVVSAIVVVISIFTLFGNFRVFGDLFELFMVITKSIGFFPIFESILLGLTACASSVLSIYAAISVGHMFNSHKIILSFGAFICFSLIESNVLFIGFNIVNKIFSIFDVLMPVDIETLLVGSPRAFLALIIAYELITGAVYFFVSQFIMTKKLNLQ